MQRVHDALDAGVVGRDAVADEAVGRRERLEQVDRDLAAGLRDLAVQDVAGVDAGGAGSDDRDAKREGHGCGGLSIKNVRVEEVERGGDRVGRGPAAPASARAFSHPTRGTSVLRYFRYRSVRRDTHAESGCDAAQRAFFACSSSNASPYGLRVTTSPTTTTAGERMPRRAACSAIVSSVPTVTRWRGP